MADLLQESSLATAVFGIFSTKPLKLVYMKEYLIMKNISITKWPKEKHLPLQQVNNLLQSIHRMLQPRFENLRLSRQYFKVFYKD